MQYLTRIFRYFVVRRFSGILDYTPIFLETEVTLKSCIIWFEFCLSPPRESVFCMGRSLAHLSPVLHSVRYLIGTHDMLEGMNLDSVNVELEMELCSEFQRIAAMFYSALSSQGVSYSFRNREDF